MRHHRNVSLHQQLTYKTSTPVACLKMLNHSRFLTGVLMRPDFGIEHPTTQIGYHIMLDRIRRDIRTPIWLKGPTASTTLNATFPPVVEALTDSLDTVALGVLFRALLLPNSVRTCQVGNKQCRGHLHLLDIVPKVVLQQTLPHVVMDNNINVNIAFPPTA